MKAKRILAVTLLFALASLFAPAARAQSEIPA